MLGKVTKAIQPKNYRKGLNIISRKIKLYVLFDKYKNVPGINWKQWNVHMIIMSLHFRLFPSSFYFIYVAVVRYCAEKNIDSFKLVHLTTVLCFGYVESFLLVTICYGFLFLNCDTLNNVKSSQNWYLNFFFLSG